LPICWQYCKKYPFYERFLLFYTPSLYIIIGFGLGWVFHKWGKSVAWAAGFLLILHPLSTTFWAIVKPETFAFYEDYNYQYFAKK